MSRVSVPTVTVVHYVDPLCPWSLGLEEPLKKLKESYRDRLRVEYRTGVAVPEIKSWMKEYGFDYDSVAKFHVQVARQTKAKFEHDFLRKTGLKSSLPACMAFKAAQLQDEEKAGEYLRRVMNAFLIEARPFDEASLIRIARETGLDGKRLAKDMSSKGVRESVEKDAKAMAKDHASFLDLILVTADGHAEKIPEAFDAEAVKRAIDGMVPGLPKYGGARPG